MAYEEIARVAEEKYGIKEANEIKKLDIFSTNELYKIKSRQGSFLMKKLCERNLKEKNIRSQIDIANHLSKKGVPAIPPVINNENDQLTSAYGLFFLLYPFIKIDKIKKPSESHFNMAIKTLHDFHNAMEDFSGKYEFWTKPMHTETDDIANFTGYHKRLKRKSVMSKLKRIKTPFAKKIKKDSAFIKKCIRKVLAELKNARFTKQTVLHFDYKKDNLFFSNGKVAAVSDFDYSHKGFVETDVAKSARYWAENEKNARINIRKFRDFIKKYSKYSKIPVNWDTYHMLAIYTVLRRIVHASQYTLDNFKNLEYLYDYDIKLLKFLIKNEKEFRKA